MAGTAIFGSIFVDIKGYPRSAYRPLDRNIGVVKFVHGGVGRNVAENFGQLGMPAQFISSIDRSAMGREVRAHLQSCHVDVSHMAEAENGMGMWLVIFDEQGNLAGSISHQPDFAAIERLILERGAEIVSQCENLVLEIDMNETIAAHLLDLAEHYNKKVYVIVGNMGVILRRPEFLTRVDCFICNEFEAGNLFGRSLHDLPPQTLLDDLIPAVRAAGIPSMIVTMGPQGAVYFDSRTGESGHCPALPCQICDTAGAGDAFLSGAVMALTRGLPLETAVRAGTKLASVVIQRNENACPPMPGFFDAFDPN